MTARHPGGMRPHRSAGAHDPVVKTLRAVVLWPADVARDWIERFVAVQGVDRAVALGALAYTAILPLLIVYASLLPRADSEDFADALIREFELRGATATTFKRAFAPANEVESSVTALGMLLLIISALSFTRGMQRMYEGAFGLENLGVRNTPRAALWLLVVTAFLSLRPLVIDALHGWVDVTVTLALSTALWLLTPYLLLGRRVSWRRLLPSAVLAAIGMAGVGVWSAIWMPRTLTSSAAQFGVIGIGFALLTYLVVVGSVVVVATTGGALIADRWSAFRANGREDVPLAVEVDGDDVPD
jgi:membrane protein